MPDEAAALSEWAPGSVKLPPIPYHLLPPNLSSVPGSLWPYGFSRTLGLSYPREADGTFTPVTPQTPGELLALLEREWRTSATVDRVLGRDPASAGAGSRRREARRRELWRLARDARLWLDFITGDVGPLPQEPVTYEAAQEAYRSVMADVRAAATTRDVPEESPDEDRVDIWHLEAEPLPAGFDDTRCIEATSIEEQLVPWLNLPSGRSECRKALGKLAENGRHWFAGKRGKRLVYFRDSASFLAAVRNGAKPKETGSTGS